MKYFETVNRLQRAELPILAAFCLFATAVTAGSFGLLNSFAAPVVAAVLIAVLCVRQGGRVFAGGIAETFRVYPLWGWMALLVVVQLLLAPGVGDDSQIYHLPNISYFLKTGSTSTFRPDGLYRPSAITAYYPRGFEAICAVFYQFPGARALIILFKLFLASGLCFLFLHHSRNRFAAACFFALFLSMQFVRDDLGNLKNDLAMAVPLVYAATVVCARQPMQSGLWMVPIASALALSIKASALLYTAPIMLMWLWLYRSQRGKQLACITGIILPFGLYFYWVNWIQTGNPLFPFKSAIGPWTLFAGKPANLFETSMMANLDATLPLFFLRGLLRVAGPGGILLLVSMLFIIPMCGIFWRRDSRHWKQTLLLVWWTLVFLMTPFTDHNGSVIHNQLFSGGTIRLALPVILLGMLMLSGITARWTDTSPGRAKIFFWMVAGAAGINLFWYDFICLMAKPENALAAVAPAGRTFNLSVLGLYITLVGALCAAVVYLKKRWLAAGLIIAAACIQQLGYPQSLTYSMRFKQLGQTSEVFRYLRERNFGKSSSVAVHSADESSFFLACINDYLLPRTGRMVYAETPADAVNADWLILCAKDRYVINSGIHGREYRISWAFLDTAMIPAGFSEVFRDGFYRIYVKRTENG